ncbi:unnamed protein product [Prorocentrum cordatum]|uniref:RanBP2-type domain-containing protein n=1 Tax=Prorocentrum cordatum TaxID=2364126 RepID=A0ABN9UTB9_9DINO|nr:unnamed protein product [Polarella glacialis]
MAWSRSSSWSRSAGWTNEAEWWQCSACRQWNQHKKCTRCGVKKVWGEAGGHLASQQHFVQEGVLQMAHSSAASAGAAPPQSNHPVRAGLDAIAAKVKEMTAEGASVVDTSQTTAEIKSLEASLAAIPQGAEFAAARSSVQAALQTARSKVVKSRPIGAQLDTCRGALERNGKRMALIDELVTQLSSLKAAALQEHERLQKELADLQAANTQRPNGILAMQNALTDVLQEMSSGAVEPAHVTEAQSLMARLLTGVQELATRAQASALPDPHLQQAASFPVPRTPPVGATDLVMEADAETPVLTGQVSCTRRVALSKRPAAGTPYEGFPAAPASAPTG